MSSAEEKPEPEQGSQPEPRRYRYLGERILDGPICPVPSQIKLPVVKEPEYEEKLAARKSKTSSVE